MICLMVGTSVDYPFYVGLMMGASILTKFYHILMLNTKEGIPSPPISKKVDLLKLNPR